MSGRATQFLEKMHSVGGPFFIQYVCVYPSSNIVVVMPVVVLVHSNLDITNLDIVNITI